MIVLTWIAALILALPTYGISIVVALIFTMYVNRKEEVAGVQARAILNTAVTLSISNKYTHLRLSNGLPPTRYSDEQIIKFVSNSVRLIEKTLEENQRFHNNLNDITQVATRFVSYSEDFDQEIAGSFINEELKDIGYNGIDEVKNSRLKR